MLQIVFEGGILVVTESHRKEKRCNKNFHHNNCMTGNNCQNFYLHTIDEPPVIPTPTCLS